MSSPAPPAPLLTQAVCKALEAARERGDPALSCSLDLGRSQTQVTPGSDHWTWAGLQFPYPARLRDRTVYYWTGEDFAPLQVFNGSLIKLVPTDWGPPTFEIDGIKMLPTAKVSPLADARTKVAWIAPRDKVVLDCCAGLGYFAQACLEQQAARILSYEKNPDVRWLRSFNSWSPPDDSRLELVMGAVESLLPQVPTASVDAVLHDPPRFGIAGELYSAQFYAELARVLRRGGKMFHYTGTPNRLTSGRDVPGEVMRRLEGAGFRAERRGDGVIASRR